MKNLNWNDCCHLTNEEKRQTLIAFGQEFFRTNGAAPSLEDLAKIGVSYMQLRYLFRNGNKKGNLRDFHRACAIETNIRQRSLSKEEMKQYLLSMPRTLNEKCPANARKDPLCYPTCTCWIPTNRYTTQQDRTNIRYNNKVWLLHRLSYALFKGDISEDLHTLHRCDSANCYNYEHLEAGDRFDNMRHCVEVGRKTPGQKRASDHDLNGPYDPKFVDLIKSRCGVTLKNEWLYKHSLGRAGYPAIMIDGKLYTISKLMLAHKLKKKYEEIDITRHLLPDGKEGQRHDLNPDHLVEGNRTDNANDALLSNMSLTKEDITFIRSAAASRALKRGDADKFDQEMCEKFSVSKNTITNIRLGTSYNAFHDGTSIGATKNTPVIQYDLQGKLIREYASVSEALRVNNYKSKNMIQDVCNGISKTYKGFVWKYKT